jgi:hypothetical protein
LPPVQPGQYRTASISWVDAASREVDDVPTQFGEYGQQPWLSELEAERPSAVGAPASLGRDCTQLRSLRRLRVCEDDDTQQIRRLEVRIKVDGMSRVDPALCAYSLSPERIP